MARALKLKRESGSNTEVKKQLMCGGVMKTETTEAKVTYAQPDGQVRVLRGQIVEDNDPDFVTLSRLDGIKKVGRKFIIAIER